jgi:hypothetical protein
MVDRRAVEGAVREEPSWAAEVASSVEVTPLAARLLDQHHQRGTIPDLRGRPVHQNVQGALSDAEHGGERVRIAPSGKATEPVKSVVSGRQPGSNRGLFERSTFRHGEAHSSAWGGVEGAGEGAQGTSGPEDLATIGGGDDAAQLDVTADV